MFRRFVFAFAACILVSVLAAPLTAHAQQEPSWRIVALSGHVQINDGERARPAQLNDTVPQGAAVSTGSQSSATIGNGAQLITMSANSRMSIPRTQRPGTTRVRQTLGSILFQVDHRTAPHFRVDTPLLAAIVKGTTFTVVVDREGETVTVADGLVEVQANQGDEEEDVAAGHFVRVDAPRPQVLVRGQTGPQATPLASARDALRGTSGLTSDARSGAASRLAEEPRAAAAAGVEVVGSGSSSHRTVSREVDLALLGSVFAAFTCGVLALMVFRFVKSVLNDMSNGARTKRPKRT